MTPPYGRDEAKAWARETMRGVCNVLMPSFSADLQELEEAGIRHDVRRCTLADFYRSRNPR